MQWKMSTCGWLWAGQINMWGGHSCPPPLTFLSVIGKDAASRISAEVAERAITSKSGARSLEVTGKIFG